MSSIQLPFAAGEQRLEAVVGLRFGGTVAKQCVFLRIDLTLAAIPAAKRGWVLAGPIFFCSFQANGLFDM